MGGSVPRETNIAGQRHSLAYINPFEEDLLNTQYRGGEGQPVPPFAGPGGIPTYRGAGAKDPRYLDSPDTAEARTEAAVQQATSTVGQMTTPKFTMADLNTGGDGNRGQSNPSQAQANLMAQQIAASSSAPQTSLRPVTRDTTPAPAVVRDERKTDTNSRLEDFANTITPNDMMEYKGGQLVYGPKHPKAGQPVDPSEKNSFGFTVGMGNTNTNDVNPGMYRGGFGSGLKTDLDMAVAAGFGNPEAQEAALLRAGYSPEMVKEYLDRTAATRASQINTGMGGGGGDDNDIVQDLVTDIADPCPEGYKMDPVTNACVIDPDIGIGAPVFTPQDPNAVAGGGGTGYTQPIGNFIPTPLQPTKMNPMQQQLNALTKSLQPQQNQQLAGGLAGIRR